MTNHNPSASGKVKFSRPMLIDSIDLGTLADITAPLLESLKDRFFVLAKEMRATKSRLRQLSVL
jgi:hypothetical protein